jgi:hypothetical protein
MNHLTELNGRAVKFAEFTIRNGRSVLDAFARDAEEGAFTLLVASLRYADDGSAVFTSIEEVYDQPFRLRERLGYLASKCAFINGLRNDDPDAKVADDARPNGHAEGEATRPSP